MKTRQIIVQVGNWDWFVNLLKALVSEPIHSVNTNRAVSAILGSSLDADRVAMIQSFKKNYAFRIFISYDLKYFYFEPVQSGLTSNVERFLSNCTIA